MPRMNRTSLEVQAKNENPEIIESLDRGLRVLQMLGSKQKPMTLSDIAKASDLPRATVRRILQTLEKGGYVISDGKLFSLTPRVLSLASAYLSSNQVAWVMQPLMDRLATEAKEVCSLAVLDGDHVVFIARASPLRVFAGGLEIGFRLPAFCSSVGRVLLGRYSNDELAAFFEKADLQPSNGHTIVDKELLIATIITDRKKGYSLVDQEAEEGFRSIAVPVKRYDGTIIAAINIGAHVDRVSTGDMIDNYLPLLKEATDGVKDLLL